MGAAGGVAYMSCEAKVEQVSVTMSRIDDEVFDTKDNLFVVFLDKAEDLTDRRQDIDRVVNALKAESTLHRLSFYYNVRKEGDPPLPNSGKTPCDGDTDKPPLRCAMYKGQRKQIIEVGPEVPTKDIVTFYKALVEKKQASWDKLEVRKVSGDTFYEDVVVASSPGAPILVQLYEDTCFLCFLMRPFVNSVAKLLADNGVPLRIMRLNVEKNDFPDDCPVARGTPTFIVFRGEKDPGRKWEEFKPKDFVDRICKEYTSLPQAVVDQMDEMQTLVSKRFQAFTQLVMWTIELQKLETTLMEASGTTKSSTEEDSSDEDSLFNTLISEMMSKDMKRTDLLYENLEYLQREVDEVEHDAVCMGIKLAELVQKKEEEQFK